MSVVSVESLRKEYGETTVLDDVELTVEGGERFVCTGANGSGKSTFLRILATLTDPTDGTVQLFDTPVSERDALRHRLAYAPEEPPLYEALTGWEQLTHVDALRGDHRAGRDRLEAAVDQFGLTEAIHHRQETYSTGMRQKVSLIQTLTHDPELVLLDEPTGGLDTETVETLIDRLDELVSDGATVVAATHDREFRERVADRHARVVDGRLEPRDGQREAAREIQT
jgi:ABC-2 type transport system ATP-binding protein